MRALLVCAVPFVCALAVPANAQLLEQKALSAAMSMTIAQTAIDTCKTNGFAVSVSVVAVALVTVPASPPETLSPVERVRGHPSTLNVVVAWIVFVPAAVLLLRPVPVELCGRCA